MDAIRTAAEALHDEAHADDRVVFRLCARQVCRNLRAAMEDHLCGDW